MPEVITNNLNFWTSALLTKSSAGRGSNGKLEAYGIKKLRELILELAVLGKLVPQDPNDEPASVLLERIAKEKLRLIKEGIIKQEKSLPEIAEETKPFTLPASWEWARLPDVTMYKVGKTPSTKNTDYWSESTADVPWVSISDMEHFGVLTDTSKRITKEAAEKVFGYEPIPKGTLLMSFKLTVGKIAILGVDAYHNEAIISIQPHSGVERNYLMQVLPVRAQEGNTKRAIMGNTLNATSISLLLIPVPPLTEQHRIVAKVDELMALCDQLEKKQANNIEAHQTLVETLLGTLTRAESQQELIESWSRIANHFDTLFTTEQSIDQLKQTILQLAVMGKLAPQDPNDEPASILLEKIAREKTRLIREGKINKEIPLPEISKEEMPYKVPNGWVFARLGNITNKIGSGSTPRGGKSAYVYSGIPFLRSQNVWNHGLELDDVAYISQETHDKMSNTVVEPNDILLNITGASLGRCAIYPEVNGAANVSQHVTIIRPTETAIRRYLHYCIMSPYTQGMVWGRQVGMAREGLSKKVLEQFEIPLPPLNEQHRIVAKVDELMALCDALKARLNDAQTTRIKLADAIVEQAVA